MRAFQPPSHIARITRIIKSFKVKFASFLAVGKIKRGVRGVSSSTKSFQRPILLGYNANEIEEISKLRY
jgi:hypothetical protein